MSRMTSALSDKTDKRLFLQSQALHPKRTFTHIHTGCGFHGPLSSLSLWPCLSGDRKLFHAKNPLTHPPVSMLPAPTPFSPKKVPLF